jgi:hypothetical protein
VLSWSTGSDCDDYFFIFFLFIIDATIIIKYVFSEKCEDTTEEIDEKLHEIDSESQNHD